MKTKVFIFLAGVAAGFAIVFALLFLVIPAKMFMVDESKLGFDETVESITQSAVQNKWSVPHVYDLQATMKKNGFDVKPVKVISLCNPQHAYKILSGERERFVSALMPCRVAVYEKDGKTWVSMMNAGLFSEILGSGIGTVMEEVTMENRTILDPVLK